MLLCTIAKKKKKGHMSCTAAIKLKYIVQTIEVSICISVRADPSAAGRDRCMTSYIYVYVNACAYAHSRIQIYSLYICCSCICAIMHDRLYYKRWPAARVHMS